MNNKKLSFWEKLSYGGGDVASCITFGTTSAYLSYYYTDIAGLSLAAVGTIIGISRVLESAANLGTGIAIDQTHSKLGKTKPFMLTTTIPLMIMFFLLFTVPDLPAAGKNLFAFVTCLGFCLLYAINNTAYGTLISMMTNDVEDRTTLGNYKMLGGGLGICASYNDYSSPDCHSTVHCKTSEQTRQQTYACLRNGALYDFFFVYVLGK